MNRAFYALSLVTLPLGLLVGCGDPKPLGTGAGPEGDNCAVCHGSERSSAPPTDLLGKSAVSSRGVGAHEAHVFGTGLGAPVTCDSCHLVPGDASDPGHLDGVWPAEVVFGGRAVAEGAVPTLEAPPLSGDRDADTLLVVSCSAVYCHGATLGGGNATRPDWNRPDPAFRACGACHGMPPPAPHPQAADCASCHGGVVNADNTIRDPAAHIDGTVQLSGTAGCSGCHGSDQNPAPPRDTEGRTATTERTVGAHQQHLAPDRAKPVGCDSCHLVPGSIDAPGHLGPPTIVFGALAVQGGREPTWDPTQATCSSTYCHGGAAPQWTLVDGSQDRCGTCHGLPPPPPHTQATACGGCHGEVVRREGGFADPTKHVDGIVQANIPSGCTGCHGTPGVGAAPPVDTRGGSETTRIGVGAHQAHLAATLSTPVACTECHLRPVSGNVPAHIDGPNATVTFGGPLGNAGATTPIWDRTAATCSSTYCHGATLEGGNATAPVWTTVDGTQKRCESCHGMPPPTGRHSSVTTGHDFMGRDCNYCHEGQTDSIGSTIVIPARHINGAPDVQIPGGSYDPVTGSCSASGCHGPRPWN